MSSMPFMPSMKTCSRSLIALAALGCLGALAGPGLGIGSPTTGAATALAETPSEAVTDASSSPPPMLRAPDPSTAPAPTPAPAAGLRIFVDPVSGELTPWPTPQQAGELAEALAGFRFEPRIEPDGHIEGLTRFELSRGGTGIRLDSRFLTATVVHLGPDGEAHIGCTHDPEAALATLAEAATEANPPATGDTAPLK